MAEEWKIRVRVLDAWASREAVTCDIRFTAVGGPHDGAALDKQFVYTHPTTYDEIVGHLTGFAGMLKMSFETPGALDSLEFEV